jgi:hypothetical protein
MVVSDSSIMEESKIEKGQLNYQWIKGDHIGEVWTVDKDRKDKQWTYFTNGQRINPTLIKEFMIKIENTQDVLQFTPPQTGPIQDQTNTVATNSSDATIIQPNVQTKQVSVMGKMIQKMSKKNVVQIPVNININIPTPAIYAMLSEGMEEEDLNQEIIDVALEQIDIDNLQDYVKEQINTFLNEYYSN